MSFDSYELLLYEFGVLARRENLLKERSKLFIFQDPNIK